jgi:hypothetical protein
MRQIQYTSLAATALAFLTLGAPNASAQNPQLTQGLAELKQAAARNKQSLTQYTWQQQETTSINGNVKKQELFQVRFGPDGKVQKTPIGSQQPTSVSAGADLGPDYEGYAQQIMSLALSYAVPDPGRLEELNQEGKVKLGSAGHGQVQLVFRDYLKPGDSMTVVFDLAHKAIQNIQVSSYLNSPQDAVTLSAQRTMLPDGTNHLTNMVINGVGKHLTIQLQNSNYQKI